jgi:hypothetical protein
VSRPGPGALTEIPAPVVVAAAVPRQPVTAGAAAGSAGGGIGGAGGAGDAAVTDGNQEAGVLPVADELAHPHLLWVQEHLHHLSKSAQTVSEPALHMGEIRSRPWWR